MNKLRGVILPKKWLEFDEIKDKVAYPTAQNKIEQLEKYIEVREQEIEELQEIINKQKEVIDKIKEILKDYGDKEDISGFTMYYISGESLIHILELLEEIE